MTAPRLPTAEDVLRLKQEEANALQATQTEMAAFQTFLEQMPEQSRALMDPEDPNVIAMVTARDKASASRVAYETVRSERASAEPMVRYQMFMKRQQDGDEPIPLIEARMHMARMNYMNAILGEYACLSVMMVQGPEVLEQYDEAKAAADKWRGEYEAAMRSFEAQPNGVLNPMSMKPFEPIPEPPQPTMDDYGGPTDDEEE